MLKRVTNKIDPNIQYIKIIFINFFITVNFPQFYDDFSFNDKWQ